jgi:transcriptional regulator with XRE-family HTH domain
MGNQQQAAGGAAVVSKIALGQLAQKIRERSGLSRPDVAAMMGVDSETIRRWEIGKFAPKPHTAEALAAKIGATPEELSQMTTLSMNSRGRNLFEGNNVPPHLRAFYESEAIAVRIRSIGLEYLPGLLQTRAYHLATQDAQVPIDPQRAQDLRELRTRRQEIAFGRAPLPRMEFLISRAALLYLDDYSEIRDEQVRRLLEVSALPGVDIRVVTGFHASMLNAYTILDLPPETGARPFVYVEAIHGGTYVEGHVVFDYVAAFQAVQDRQSVPIEEVLG